jgi:hypothetical protein
LKWLEADEKVVVTRKSKMSFQTIVRTVVNTVALSLVTSSSGAIMQYTIDVQTARAVSMPPSPVAEHDLEVGFGTGTVSVPVAEGH